MSCVPIIKLSRHYLYSRLSGRIYCELLRVTKWHSACVGRSETARISVTPTPTLSFPLHKEHGHRKLWRILTEDCKLHPSQLMSKLDMSISAQPPHANICCWNRSEQSEGGVWKYIKAQKYCIIKLYVVSRALGFLMPIYWFFMSNQDKESTISFDIFKHSFPSC